MFSLFKKLKGNDKRDLEQIIFDIAEHKRNEDFHLLHLLMKSREVFVPVDTGSVPPSAHPGVPYMTRPGDNVRIRTVELPHNGLWVPAATKPTNRMLSKGYVGMPWLGCLAMATKIENARGIYLQGETSWVALDKQRITHVLSLAAT